MAGAINPQSFSDSLVILGAAGVVIPGFARLRISPVIGFILVGLAVGPSGLGALVGQYPWLYHVTISNRAAIEPFAELGVILLLFSIGLELSFRRLWTMRTQVFGVGAAELIGGGTLIALGLYLLGQAPAGAFGLGLALALSSTAVVLPMVGTQSAVGRAAFSMLLFEDLALVPIIFMLGALAPSVAASPDGPWTELADTLLKSGITIAVMLVLGRLCLPHIFSQAARTKSPEVFLAASLLVVIVSSMATSIAGLSPIVGALLAGLLIAETDYHGEVEVMTAPFKGLALGVFLITVGMGLDVRVILANWPTLILAVIGVVLAKTIVTAALLYLSGARKGVALEVGVLMSSPSETTLIVLSAAAAGAVDPPVYRRLLADRDRDRADHNAAACAARARCCPKVGDGAGRRNAGIHRRPYPGGGGRDRLWTRGTHGLRPPQPAQAALHCRGIRPGCRRGGASRRISYIVR